MRIGSLGQLELALDNELSWRKRELTLARFAIDTAPHAEQRVLTRAGTALLYAHWEGFVKKAATSYVELVARQSLNVATLAIPFVALGYRKEIHAAGASKGHALHVRLVEMLAADPTRKPRIRWNGAIRTRSNLSARVFRDIVETIGLEFSRYELRMRPVIDRLVKARNAIAHGHGIPMDPAVYGGLHTDVIGLLDDFRDHISDAAAAARYRR